jgi:hypothetical protein
MDNRPGSVGQEIYGAGAAFIFATRSFHPVENASFRLFCDHFIMANERTGDRAISIALAGGETCTAMVSVVRTGRDPLPKVTVKVHRRRRAAARASHRRSP